MSLTLRPPRRLHVLAPYKQPEFPLAPASEPMTDVLPFILWEKRGGRWCWVMDGCVRIGPEKRPDVTLRDLLRTCFDLGAQDRLSVHRAAL